MVTVDLCIIQQTSGNAAGVVFLRQVVNACHPQKWYWNQPPAPQILQTLRTGQKYKLCPRDVQGIFHHIINMVSQLSADVAPDTRVALGNPMLGGVMDRFRYFVVHGAGGNRVFGVEAMGRIFWLLKRSTKKAKQCLMMLPRWLCENGCAHPARSKQFRN